LTLLTLVPKTEIEDWSWHVVEVQSLDRVQFWSWQSQE
jgi:hypothetical protein